MSSSSSVYVSTEVPESQGVESLWFDALLSRDGQTPSAPWSLAVVALEDILIHEVHDPSRAEPLVKAIIRDGMQRHPVILAPHQDGRLVHLDGANRITALSRLGCRHVAAQLVDYADPATVTLDSWWHLTRLSPRELRTAAAQWSDCELARLSTDRALDLLVQERTVAALVFDHGEAFILLSGMGLADRVAAMRQLTALYPGNVQREIRPDGDLLAGIRDLLSRNPQANVCVAFAPLRKADVITLACNMGTQIPAGITRHVITCGRGLNVNAPLSLLQSDLSAAEKTARLGEMLAGQRQRIYVEPTIVYESY